MALTLIMLIGAILIVDYASDDDKERYRNV